MVITEFITRLGFELDEHQLKNVESGIEAIKDGLLGLTVELGGAGEAIWEVVKGTAEAAFQARNNAISIGTNVEKYSELKHALSEVGVGQEEFSTGMVILQSHFEGARRGSSEAIQTLTKMGLPLGAIMNGSLDAADAVEMLTKRFTKMNQDPHLKNQMVGQARNLLGRSGARWLPYLTQGAEAHKEAFEDAHELGLVITEEQANSSQHFIVSLEKIFSFIVGIKREIGFGLQPVAQKWIDETYRWLKANRELIKSNLGGFIKGIAEFIMGAMGPVKAFADSIMGFITLFGGAERATKLFLASMALLSAGSVLYGLGKLVMVLRSIRLEALWAGAAAALPVLAWGAAVAALGLIVDDVWGYFHGKKSVTGLVVEFFSDTVPKAIHKWVDWVIFEIDALIEKLSAKYPLISKAFEIMTGLGKLAGGLFPEPNFGGGVPTNTSTAGLSLPTLTPISGSRGGTITYQINAPQTNNFPSGTPADMSSRVHGATKSGISSAISQATAINSSGVAQ